MIKSIYRLSVLFAFLVISQVVLAQGKTIVEQDGKKYYQHVVQHGNTLYAIAKLYQVDEDLITRYNPDASQGLQPNMVLLIPIESEDLEDKWTNPIRIEGHFLIHRVKKKETLYGISKEYKVTVNDILENNPTAESGISKKMELRIPINDIDESTLEEGLSEITVLDSTIYVTHKVELGETLYYLSKYYDVEIDDIKSINNGLDGGLKLGSTILIRYKIDEELQPEVEKEDGLLTIFRNDEGEKSFNPTDYNIPKEVYRNSYKIALMLPLYLEESLGGSLPRKESKLQEIAYHFYEGVMIAVDSLKEYGVKAEVYVFDVNGNDKSLDDIFNRPEMQNIDLVIGPFQKSQFIEASELCIERGIHLVCPVSQSNKILVDHPNVSKAHPSTYTQMEMLAVDVVDKHHNDNVILINSIDTKDALMVSAFRDSYKREISNYPTSKQELLEIKSSVSSIGNITNLLVQGKKNIVVVPSKDKIAVQDIFTQLSRTNKNNYDITIYGIEDWWDYNFISIESKSRFHLTVGTPSYINYSNTEVIDFVDSFTTKLGLEPSKYAFKGYDIMTYYGKGLLQFGLAFPKYFQQIDQSGLLLSKFDYFQPDERTGYENRYIYILETTDHSIDEH